MGFNAPENAKNRLKYKKIAFETLMRAHDNTFAKNRHMSESRFINKMCSFSVQNDKMRSEQMCLLTFFDIIHAYEKFQKNI